MKQGSMKGRGRSCRACITSKPKSVGSDKIIFQMEAIHCVDGSDRQALEVTASRWYYFFCRPWRFRAFLIPPIILANKYPISGDTIMCEKWHAG